MPARTINNLGGSAGRKRNRRDEEIDEVRQASSGLQSDSRRKRVRVSEGKQSSRRRAASESTVSSSDEDDDVEMQVPARDDAPQATQYEIMRDAGFEDLQYAEEDDSRVTARLKGKTDRQSNRAEAQRNRAAPNGILKSITCINFMCHQKLHVELGANLNFIVGENGSGKSAILTAITLCLGGKASSTNRGGNIKAFIKEGQNEGRVRVQIKNEGDDAYQPEIYGDTITVERRFKITGSNTFRTLSAAGATISDRKAEVNNITEYYCLQVDNPLNVLSQDNARQFLNAASAKQKYKFFMQGVQLQQLDDDYRVTEEMINTSESKETDLENKLDLCRQDYNTAKKDHALLQESDDMRQRFQLLRQKILWAQVVEQERKITEYMDRRADADLAIENAQEELAAKTTELETQDAKIAQASEEANAVKEERGTLETDLEEAVRKWEQAKMDLQKLSNEERDAHTRLARGTMDVRETETQIQDEEQRLNESLGDAHAQKLQALNAARANVLQIDNETEEVLRRVPVLNENCDKAKKEVTTVDTFMKQKQGEIKGIQKRLHDLGQGQSSLYDGYEKQMQNLLRMIEGDGGFEHKPVGPIGAHVQVAKPIWSPMLERLFGESLNAFVVTNKRDQQRLSGMMSRLRMSRSPILIGNLRPIDTTSNEPDQNFDTVLRILKIDDPLIRNQLIINNRIEKTILIESQHDAEEAMFNSSPPRNVTACYHLLPKKGRGWTCRLGVNANGVNSAPQAPTSAQQPPRLKSDSVQETSHHKEQLTQLQTELRELQIEKQAHQGKVSQITEELADAHKTVNKNKQTKRQAQVEVDEIQGQLDSYEGVDTRLQGLRQDLEKARENAKHFGLQYGELSNKKQQQNDVCEKLRENMKSEKIRTKEYEARLAKAEDRVKRYEASRQLILVAKNEAHDRHQIALNQRNRLEKNIKLVTEIAAEFEEQAREQHERVHIADDETYLSIEKKLESVAKALKDGEKKRGKTDTQIRARLEETRRNLDTLQKNINSVQSRNKLLKRSLEERLDKWRKFRRYISSNSRANFMYMLAERKFRGKLILDHEHHTLEVQIEPDATRKDAAARSTKTLSGGEKSFASICLLLAIWEAMGSPIRCLDEFDVFMDNVNRAISTDMLCDAARNSVGRQFILITPNAIEGRAKLAEDVTITRLTDPRQRQIPDMI